MDTSELVKVGILALGVVIVALTARRMFPVRPTDEDRPDPMANDAKADRGEPPHGPRAPNSRPRAGKRK